jgi:hypothetical protein
VLHFDFKFIAEFYQEEILKKLLNSKNNLEEISLINCFIDPNHDFM